MKITILQSIALITIASSSFAQSNSRSNGIFQRENIHPLSNVYYAKFSVSEDNNLAIEGSAYIEENLRKANINENEELVPFRYNALIDMIEVSAPNNRTFALVKEKGNKISNNDITYVVFEDVEESNNRFFRVELDLKNVSLLVKESVVLKEAKVSYNSYTDDSPTTLKRSKDAYYISFLNYEALKLPKNKNKFCAVFGDKKSDIRAFIKKNNLNHRRKNDIIHILKYYNQL